jgi:nucleoid-associated protein YgaU
LRIELADFASFPDATRWRSQCEVESLLMARDLRARRVLEEVYDALSGTYPKPQPGDARGPSFESALRGALRSAAHFGRLQIEPVERVRFVRPPTESAAQDVLGPESTRDAAPVSKTWVGMTLVDQNGTPLPNRPYRVIQPDGTTVDATLDSNGSAILKGLDAGNCQIWCPYVAPRAASTYTVQDGDHISAIAQAYGYDDYTTLWNDPANADLQAQRSDPHVLQPGDVLTIPEVKAAPAANKPTSAKHPFTLNVSPLKLRLVMLDLAANPIASAPVTIAGTALTTDGNGLVEATIDKTAQDVTLDAPDVAGDLQAGALNPPDDATDAGYKARLFNLGFLWDDSVDDTDDEMIVALQDFQAQYALDVSGQLDDATKAQLLQTYGA